MKFFSAQFSYFFEQAKGRNLRLLIRFLVVLKTLVSVYSVVFHEIMEWEGQKHSWTTGIYWTLTVMSTLGFGDITFESDAGRLFSIVVLLSGMIFLLILLPFTFIEFFYAPWIKAQHAARAPRRVPKETRGHVIITNFDPVTRSLIGRLNQYGYDYALIVENVDEALELHDEGFSVVIGDIDDPDTYENVAVRNAAMVVATGNDTKNTNIAFTVRGKSANVPIVTTAASPDSVDILEMAGSSFVLQLDEMMGRALARHAIGGDAQAHKLGMFDQIVIAEAGAAGTPLVGKTLAKAKLRESVGVMVVGIWNRGRIEFAGPDTTITDSTVLLLAGSQEHIDRYNELFCIYHIATAPVVIIGGGRVGRAIGRSFETRKTEYRIVEQLPERAGDPETYVLGSAADITTLERAGIREAPTVIITPHHDDTNVFLTIYCRRLRPDVQLIVRSVREKNVPTLHRAGADFVLSYSTMGANAIFNALKRGEVLMVAEGLNLFRMKVPRRLQGRSLAEAGIRQKTGCNVVAVRHEGNLRVNPDPGEPLHQDAELILISSSEGQEAFLKRYARRK
jgi:voltage-gated potassium channel